jgi:hypothetical protein
MHTLAPAVHSSQTYCVGSIARVVRRRPVVVARPRAIETSCGDLYMKRTVENDSTDEPMGIVISRGARQEPAPSVFAYEWAPAPEEIDEAFESQGA